MNLDLDRPWISLTVREYLVIERAWGWGTAILQMVVVAGGVYLVRKGWMWWRARRAVAAAAAAPVPPGPSPNWQAFGEAFDRSHPATPISRAPCPACGSPIDAVDAELFREGLYIDGGSELGRLASTSPRLAWGLQIRESGHSPPAPAGAAPTEPSGGSDVE